MAQAAHLQLRLGEFFFPSCATDINRHLKRLPGCRPCTSICTRTGLTSTTTPDAWTSRTSW